MLWAFKHQFTMLLLMWMRCGVQSICGMPWSSKRATRWALSTIIHLALLVYYYEWICFCVSFFSIFIVTHAYRACNIQIEWAATSVLNSLRIDVGGNHVKNLKWLNRVLHTHCVIIWVVWIVFPNTKTVDLQPFVHLIYSCQFWLPIFLFSVIK